MTLLKIFEGSVALNLFFAVAWFWIWSARKTRWPAAKLLDLSYKMIVRGMLPCLLTVLFFPQVSIFHPVAKIWAASSAEILEKTAATPQGARYLSGSAVWQLGSWWSSAGGSSALVMKAILALFFLMSILAVMILFLNIQRLKALLSTAIAWKKIGAVEIWVSEQVSVPFSCWLPGRALVFIPSSALSKSGVLKISVLHELQHHRQRDTVWLYVFLVLRIFWFWNPFVHLWNGEISELQEFACDETLVKSKVSSKAYASCLVWVAETVLHDKERRLACATGLGFLYEGQTLKRRIHQMILQPKPDVKRKTLFVTVAGALLLFATAAAASWSFVQDRRVTFEQADQLARNVRSHDNFPVVVNDMVLKELNLYLGTPDGREFMRQSLQRMQNYSGVVGQKIQQYNVPVDLAAIPIIESSYEDLPQSSNAGWGAGLWMFIRNTAIAYGLNVNGLTDDRLNAELETDAAMRYLTALRARFNDWSLAILAYNIGETAVQAGINKTGSRDAWTLLKDGVSNEPEYLPRVMAAVLIMRNPSSLNGN